MPELDPGTIVRVLNKHGVRYVVIGGIAAEIHDLPVPTTVDLDVTPARDRKNLERLAVRLTSSRPGSTRPKRQEPGSRARPSSCGRSTTPST